MPARLGITLIVAVFLAATAAADVQFISPVSGSQAVGVQVIEIESTSTGIDRVEFRVDGLLAGVARSAPWRIEFDFGESLATREITAEVFSAHYQHRERGTIRTATPGIGETVTVRLVEVPIQFRGRKIPSSRDLSVFENGTRQEILELRNSRGPTSFLFVVDRSSSMSNGKLRSALEAVGGELSSLRSGDDARIVFFNHLVDAPQPVATKKDVERIRVEPSGGTSLRDAVASLQPGRRAVVIVITDGGDRNSELTDEEALRKVTRGNVTLFAIALGSGNARGFLRQSATSTGGRVLQSSPQRLAADLRSVMAEVDTRWIVSYQSSNIAAGWRTIEVSARGAMAVRAERKGYYAQ
ncbi:MAG: VWA domain-containing protein [Acidobacteriota bacterium]